MTIATCPLPAPVRPAAPEFDPLPTLTNARAANLFGDEAGAATAEYAVATMAAVSAKKQSTCQRP